MRSLFPLAAAAVAASTSAVAQALELDLRGGSMPGVIEVDVHPGFFPFELMFVVPSTSSGPTPCAVFDPMDPRSLRIGLELVGSGWAGFCGIDLHYRFQLPVGALPALSDLPLFFQAVTFQWAPTILNRISNPNVIRFGPAGTFRNRQVFFSNERAFATVLPRLDRRWLLVGGARGQLLAQVATDTTEIYDPIGDAFELGPSLSTPRSMHTATLLPDGRWLIAGGVNGSNDPQNSCEIYDPVLDLFTPAASMVTPRMGQTATLLPGGKVLVTGGIRAMPTAPTQLEPIRQTVNSTELYDPLTDTWTPGPNMSTPRAAHVAILRPNGTVALCGGISWDSNILFGWLPAVRASCEIYNPVTNTFTAGPAMATARSLTDAVDLGGNRWLLAGGINGITIIPWNPGNPTAAAEIYDANTNTWSSVGALATARGNHRAWSLGNGQFLLAGGANNSILSPTPLASTEIFSVATNSFSPGPAMQAPRAGAAAFETPQGQIMLFGGSSIGSVIVQSTEWYYR